ncbi:saccharopine dehydrogenase LYS [Acrasis kona]|uniref:Saccharopine dehydrogenase LYS n=1 Tax=Acrasis kona TaxID=1008807 RepID=A0AAW2YYW6_9EUKA
MADKRILLLGSGYVTTTVVEYLTRRPENILTLANRTVENAEKRSNDGVKDRIKVVQLDLENDDAKLEQLVRENDIVISLVPYLYHVKVAKVCLQEKKHLVTTSYISPAMRELHQQAVAADVILMNEIGVDPGIDHLAAVKIIDDVRKEGGEITSFYSWCGGLPVPDRMDDNPLKYKFSWSPKGVLMASRNVAKFIEDGKTVTVDSVLDSSRKLKLSDKYPAFDGYPNRDSTQYVEEYNIPKSRNVLRGTLRYNGFCSLLKKLLLLGLIENSPASSDNWRQVTKNLVGAQSDDDGDIKAKIAEKLNLKSEEAEQLFKDLTFFGLLNAEEKVGKNNNLLDAFATLLQKKCYYDADEPDFVFLQHIFEAEFPNGSKQTRKATLALFGDDKFSAMAKGTGLPCAVVTQLILDNKVSRRGVVGPMHSDLNDLITEGLKGEKIEVEFETINQ